MYSDTPGCPRQTSLVLDLSFFIFINICVFVPKTTHCCVELSYSMVSVSPCFQAATKETNAEERLTPVVLAQQAAQLKQQLVSAHLDSLLGPQAHINLADPDGALARWAEGTGRGGGQASGIWNLKLQPIWPWQNDELVGRERIRERESKNGSLKE